MTKRLSSKHKVDRRLRVNLWGRPKSPFNTRNYPPGQHGKTKRNKPSDYGTQLEAKQKMKFYYGNMNERQFRNVYRKAIKKKGNTSENLVEFLERRLDTVIYRAKFATTVFSARQLINHGHITVNGKKVNIPSYILSKGDEIAPVQKKIEKFPIKTALQNMKDKDQPHWLSFDTETKKGIVQDLPTREDITIPIQEQLIVELYSR